MNNLLKKCIAEFVGTFVLVFCACGVAGATGGSLVATALTFGLVIVAMAYSIGRISGCHINPAVSFGLLLAKKMSLKEFAFYVISQVVGGLLGGILVFGLFKMAGVDVLGNACNTYVGYKGTLSGMGAGNIIAALLTEIVLTFIFVYVILNVTDSKAGNGKIAGIVIGLTLTLVHLIGITLTGTSVNPARSIATAFTDLIYNQNTDALAMVWVFIVGPLGGAALSALAYHFLHKKDEDKEEDEKETATKPEETESK